MNSSESRPSNDKLRTGVFGLDTRSLAVFRIAVGVLLLVDLGMRFSSLEAMYTDAGLFTIEHRAEYLQQIANSKDAMSWSLHTLSGSETWQVVLFAAAALAAFMLTVGWHTRWATILSWLLLVSLHSRNPLILHSGDTLLRLLLLWSIFLPLGGVWSLDARKKSNSGIERFGIHRSLASVGLILVVFSLYFFAGCAKLNDYWFSGNAMQYVLRLDIYVTTFGKFLLQYPTMLKWVTWATLWGEILVPFLLFVPWRTDRFRLLAMAVFWLLHISIAMAMNIGLFCFISMAAWLPLLPTSFWRAIGIGKLSVYQKPERFGRSPLKIASTAFCGFFICYSLGIHLSNLPFQGAQQLMPSQAYAVGKWLNMKQAFQMFDVPPLHSPWFVYDAILDDDTQMDIMREKPVSHERPASVLATIPTHHWRRLHRNISRSSYRQFRGPTAEYVVRRWNATHPMSKQVKFMKLTAYLDEIGPDYNGLDQITQVWKQVGDPSAQPSLFDSLMDDLNQRGEILP